MRSHPGTDFNTRLGYEFEHPELLRQALTHRSHSAPHNERLEFLGDGVLNCVIAALLYERFPNLPEGHLSRLRANLVNQECLGRIALSLDLGGELRLGEGELKSGGFRRPSILADALEAVTGAIFLDGGYETTTAVLTRIFDPLLSELDPNTLGKDPKTLLQEVLQGRRLALPQYNVVSVQGEAHEQQFHVECVIPGLEIRTTGSGPSRRSAEQSAARLAYELIAQQ
jgi:ribonuclease-3